MLGQCCFQTRMYYHIFVSSRAATIPDRQPCTTTFLFLRMPRRFSCRRKQVAEPNVGQVDNLRPIGNRPKAAVQSGSVLTRLAVKFNAKARRGGGKRGVTSWWSNPAFSR